jgi:DNA polymerase III epsilon subunit-like protein
MKNDYKNIVYFDTETTGTETEDRIIQLAYRTDGLDYTGYFRPPLPIKLMAMAVHHITQKQVEKCLTFANSSAHQTVKEFIKEGKIFVAHNAKFDIGMLAKEGIKIPTYICTLKVIKYLDTDLKCECYQQQYLRYLAGIEVEADAHDAWGDILVLEQLFIKFVNSIMKREKLTFDKAISKMIDISSKPSEIKKFSFGKYKGSLFADVAKNDKGYLQWLYREKLGEPEPDEDWIYTLEKYVRP